MRAHQFATPFETQSVRLAARICVFPPTLRGLFEESSRGGVVVLDGLDDVPKVREVGLDLSELVAGLLLEDGDRVHAGLLLGGQALVAVAAHALQHATAALVQIVRRTGQQK